MSIWSDETLDLSSHGQKLLFQSDSKICSAFSKLGLKTRVITFSICHSPYELYKIFTHPKLCPYQNTKFHFQFTRSKLLLFYCTICSLPTFSGFPFGLKRPPPIPLLQAANSTRTFNGAIEDRSVKFYPTIPYSMMNFRMVFIGLSARTNVPNCITVGTITIQKECR